MATLHVTSQGSLTLTVETDTVSVTSHFDDLHVENNSITSVHKLFLQVLIILYLEEDETSVTVELKRLSNFLINEQLNPNRVVCDVVRNKLMRFNFLSDSFNLQYFLPAVAM